MSAVEKAIWLVKLPFRVAWTALLILNFLIVAPVVLAVGAFVIYWVALTISYILLPEAWTAAMWAWGSGLYADHMWVKVATIGAFTVLVSPIFLLAKDGRTDEEIRKEDEERLRLANDALIAQRNQREWDARWRESMGLPPSP